MASFIAWVVAHEGVLAGLVVGVLDFVISIIPSVSANSLVEFVLSKAQAILSAVPASAPAAPVQPPQPPVSS